MDFGNPKNLRLLTICILFRVLKPLLLQRLEEEEGGGWQIVTDFVTRLMRPKYLLKKSDSLEEDRGGGWQIVTHFVLKRLEEEDTPNEAKVPS